MKPTVIIFVARGCPACAMFKPLARRVAGHYRRCVRTHFVDGLSARGDQLSDQLHVEGFPTAIAYDGQGKEVKRLEGFSTESAVLALYDKALRGASCDVRPYLKKDRF